MSFKEKEYCDFCKQERTLGHVKTETSFGKQFFDFRVCIPCIKKIEGLKDYQYRLVETTYFKQKKEQVLSERL